MSKYKNQYQHPNWQKKRLEILNRDNFTCQSCNEKQKMLYVHHKFYLKGQDVWDYPDYFFVTLCEECHDYSHQCIEIMYNTLSMLPFDVLLHSQESDISDLLINDYEDCLKRMREVINSSKSIDGPF